MSNLDIDALWKEYDRKLEESRVLNLQTWAVSKQTFEWLQAHKARSRLRPMGVFKGWAVFLGILWAVFLGALVVGNHEKNLYFSFSVGMILLFTLYAIVVYGWQMALIRQIDYSENIVDTQQKLSQLQASTLRSTRILFLQTPFYSTWFWSGRLIGGSPAAFWLLAAPVAVGLGLAALWLYRNIRLENTQKRWFRLLFNGIEWTPILRAMDHLKEIEEFKAR